MKSGRIDNNDTFSYAIISVQAVYSLENCFPQFFGSMKVFMITNKI